MEEELRLGEVNLESSDTIYVFMDDIPAYFCTVYSESGVNKMGGLSGGSNLEMIADVLTHGKKLPYVPNLVNGIPPKLVGRLGAYEEDYTPYSDKDFASLKDLICSE